ncbi:MAG: hypothetical protein LAT82_04860 [Nanoarchaeota archaeon]|nr:hypothetical protein [Nanoarchaeota archaeon]
MSIFSKNNSKLTLDDEKIIQLIIEFLEDEIKLDAKGEAKMLDLEEWNSVILYAVNQIEFNHKLQTTFSFEINTENNTLILHNFHRISKFKKMGDGTFVLQKLTQLFQEVCKVKQISKLVILFEIWGIEDPSSEFVRKLLIKEGYTKIQDKDPEEWLIEFKIS